MQTQYSQPNQPSLAIVFFGIPRSLKFTLNSINRCVLRQLPTGMQSTVFCSFFKESFIRHPETREVLALDPTEAQLLEPDHLLEIPSFNDELEELLGTVKPFGDAWQNDFYSTKNLIKQLATLELATQQVLKHRFNACLFLRPDLTYLDEFGPLLNRVIQYTNVGHPTVFLPNWGLQEGKMTCLPCALGPLPSKHMVDA